MDKSNARPNGSTYLLYILVVLPWIADYLEYGRWPSSPIAWMVETALSLFIGAGILALQDYQRQIARHREEIERLSRTDALTMLGHPGALEEALVKEIARARRMDRPLSCIFFDLDDFKNINDRFGYATGNSVLQTVGKTLRGAFRQGVDMTFRYGGDEFVIILPEADKARAHIIAQRLQKAIGALRPPAIPIKSLQASLTVAQLRPSQVAMDLLNLVDKAAHRAKARAKNSIFDAEELEKELPI
jgi:diguanylate cyclase (GGDEF)-like protein